MTPDQSAANGRSFEARYGAWVVRWRWPVLFASLILIALAASGARFLGFDNSYRVFFGPDNPQLLAFEAVENIYTKNDNVLFALAHDEEGAFSSEMLAIVADLTDRAWQLPYARRVDSPTNFQNTRATEDDLVVEDLVIDPKSRSEEELAAALEVALAEPQVANRLVTEAAEVTGVNVTLELPGKSPFEVTEVATEARKIAAELSETYPGLSIHLTGVAMLNNAFAENSQKDMQSLVPLMFGAMVLVVGFLLRSIAAAGSTLLVIMMSTAVGMGLAGWLGVKITPPSSVAPTMIMTLSVADSIHLLVTMLASMRKGFTKHDAIVESIRVNFMPIFLTSVTTAIGFVSLNLSDAPPFRDLGNISAMGVMAALVISMTLLPALLAVLPMRQKAGSKENLFGVESISRFVLHRSRPILWTSAAIILIAVFLIPRNRLNDQFVQYFDESIEFRADTDFINENLTGIYTIDYDLQAGESGGISNPEYLAYLEKFEEWYRQQDGVIQISSLSHVLKRLNKNMHADDPAYFRLPESRELAAQYLLLYEMSLPYGLDLNNQVNVDKSASRFTVTLGDMAAEDMRDINSRAQAWLAENVPASMEARGVGPILMFAYISERNVRSMLVGTFLALFLISVCLVFALRSVKYGVLSLVPNLVPAILTFGMWGIFMREINLGLANVMAMSLGIVADDTIHFLSKYLRARREQGLSADEAVNYAFVTVGKALVVTSVILIIGFAVMTRSAFALNSNMGWFTVITIAVALIADFTLLPALLLKIDRKKEPVLAAAEAPSPAPAIGS